MENKNIREEFPCEASDTGYSPKRQEQSRVIIAAIGTIIVVLCLFTMFIIWNSGRTESTEEPEVVAEAVEEVVEEVATTTEITMKDIDEKLAGIIYNQGLILQSLIVGQNQDGQPVFMGQYIRNLIVE